MFKTNILNSASYYKKAKGKSLKKIYSKELFDDNASDLALSAGTAKANRTLVAQRL